MQEHKELGLNPIRLNESPEIIQDYIIQKGGNFYDLYVSNVNPHFTEFECSLLGKQTIRVIAKAIYQNNRGFIESSRTKEIKRKRKSELRKCLIKLLNCHKNAIYLWIGI